MMHSLNSITHVVEKFAIEFTDPDGLKYSPSVPLNTWVEIDRFPTDTIAPPNVVTPGAVMVFCAHGVVHVLLVHVHSVCSVMTLTQRSDNKPSHCALLITWQKRLAINR